MTGNLVSPLIPNSYGWVLGQEFPTSLKKLVKFLINNETLVL